ncbi:MULTISPECIES: N-acetylmuramoyl-L-alanine amidase [Bacteroides]|uniref:N-acetylmuramoyl-L-alanine amidase n=1 Tax=Bacteroides TaxID=816 RepID=UPI00210EC8BB|nr:N-acetylmuramoyl-L-alanine amidase [Bacteroides nordii]MCQ4915649.1 N-acetylmuramoyl-L-alanine amidase [Bacteroides nordii]
MNKIDSIIIHCSATRAGQDFRAKDIDHIHKQRGFAQIGYNFIIDLDGTVENGRPLSIDGAHCNTKGFSEVSYNKHSIGICYIGGLDITGQPADTRTETQKNALRDLVAKLCKEYDIVELLGHRDTSPDLNGNGEVEPAEYIKACPCFDVRSEFSNFLRNTIVKP